MSELRLTVEQICLLQKLIRSGLNKEQLLQAFDEVERFENQQQNGPKLEPLPSNDCLQSPSSVASFNDWHSSVTQPPHLNLVLTPQTNVEMPPSTSTVSTSFRTPGKVIQYEETPALEYFKAKGDETILREIRKFVSAYNISQITIADMIRVSQGYVSRYMNGEIDQVSNRVKNLIYLWYLECRNNPRILQQCLGSRAVVSENGDLLPIRRDKFKFHKCHLLILERIFHETIYPNNDTKRLLVETCNYTLAKHLQRPLMDNEKVTLNLVNTWFNNRRKELKPPANATNNSGA